MLSLPPRSLVSAIRRSQARAFHGTEKCIITPAQKAGAGVRCTLHDLRRSFGSRYAVQVTAPVLQRLMRHASIQTTMAFYTNVEGALDEAILKG